MKTLPKLCFSILITGISGFAQEKTGPLTQNPTLVHARHVGTMFSSVEPQFTPGVFPDSITQRITWRPYNAATIVVQVGATLGAEAIVLGATLASTDATQDVYARIPMYLLGVGIAVALAPNLVYYPGRWMGGNGTESGTEWGMMLGAGIALVATLPQTLSGSAHTGNIFALVAFGGVAGAVIGYHSSSSAVYENNAPGKPLTLQLFQGSDAQQLPRAPQNVSRLNIRCVVVSVQL